MRLIDADALEKNVDNEGAWISEKDDVIHYCVNYAPTVDAFICPIRIGQKIYRINQFGVYEETVDSITFGSNGKWYASEAEMCECIANSDTWMDSVFPTREEAEEFFKIMRVLRNNYLRRSES